MKINEIMTKENKYKEFSMFLDGDNLGSCYLAEDGDLYSKKIEYPIRRMFTAWELINELEFKPRKKA